MRSKNVFWGVVLVSIGILFVLRNIGVIYFTWGSIFNLWPVFLIVLGISLLPINGIVRILLAFFVVVFSLIFISNTDYYNRYQYFEPHNWFRWENDDYSNFDEDENYEWRDQQLFEDYNEEINNAVLDLDAIAGEFVISETTDYLLKFDRQGNFGKYYLRADNAGSAVVLKIDMDSYIENGPKLKNEARIRLHPDPLWNIKVDAGASKLDFDLSPFKIDRMDIDGGASSINIKLGDRYENTELIINSGAAATFIEVPQNVGCRVETNTVLSSKT
ncbi:MAG: DUF5668 domain-containing protein, partial [Bacteroidales bacterium]|nr:DUF5668 domain-containing protein [Bacteroidales bacterium]